MAEDAHVNDKAQKWYTSLPAIIGAAGALVAAVGGILALVLPKAGAGLASGPRRRPRR